jgi:hypothetical protein
MTAAPQGDRRAGEWASLSHGEKGFADYAQQQHVDNGARYCATITPHLIVPKPRLLQHLLPPRRLAADEGAAKSFAV